MNGRDPMMNAAPQGGHRFGDMQNMALNALLDQMPSPLGRASGPGMMPGGPPMQGMMAGGAPIGGSPMGAPGGIGPFMQNQLMPPMMPPWAGPMGLNFGLPAFGAVPPGSPYTHPLPNFPGYQWPGIDQSQFTQGGAVEPLAGPEQAAVPEPPAPPQYFHAPGTQDYYSLQNDIWTPLAGAPVGVQQFTPLNIDTAPGFYGL